MAAFAASLSLPLRGSAVAPAVASRPPLTATRRRAAAAAAAPSASPTRMTATTGSDIRIRLYGNNIKITSSLRDYVEKKIGKVVGKYSAYCSKVDVHLTVQPSVPAGQSAEVVIFHKKNIFRRLVSTADMYASIDEVEEKLSRTLRKFKERKEGKNQKASGVDAVSTVFVDVSDDESADELDDTFAASSDPSAVLPKVVGLVKRKTFPLPLQTIEEAILCLDYIDHSFYMFRLADTGKVCLVYRRNHGGYGLIEPDEDDE